MAHRRSGIGGARVTVSDSNRPRVVEWAARGSRPLGVLRYSPRMAPTIVRDGQFRLFFFSREETRIHVHVAHPDGEAKF
jgi:hypothetical protein